MGDLQCQHEENPVRQEEERAEALDPVFEDILARLIRMEHKLDAIGQGQTHTIEGLHIIAGVLQAPKRGIIVPGRGN